MDAWVTESNTSDAFGSYLNNRFTLAERWRLCPRLPLDQRKSGENRLELVRIGASLRLDYRYSRRFRLELEAGYEWSSREMATVDLNIQGLFVSAGCRAVF